MTDRAGSARLGWRPQALVVLVASLIFLGSIGSPPSLMDDVDAVQASIARTMLESGDWVTARLNGIAYLEKPPLKYWMMAASMAVFGPHDWAARLPIALAAVLLAWVTACFGAWAFSLRAGLYAGLALATSLGLFLFTRVMIVDVALTLAVALALWAFLRAIEEGEPRPRLWAAVYVASMGVGLLLKGLIGVLFPAGIAAVYLLLTGRFFDRRTWQRLHPLSGLAILLAIAAPWHVLATLRNPPLLDFTLASQPGEYRGFFWFYFINEHLLRYLGLRYPKDYDQVPLAAFWLYHLVWLFPWSACLGGTFSAGLRGTDRPTRARLLALVWIGVVLVFFSFSTTQEYYSMPCYPAFALLAGFVLAEGGRWAGRGLRIAGALAGLAAIAAVTLLAATWRLPAPGDISHSLTHNPEAYTLALGHIGDLTLASFAYLRAPLALAAAAFLVGSLAAWRLRGQAAVAALAAMMVLFAHAARLALVTFDPYLSSRPLAEALEQAPPGQLIVDDQYYAFSSVFFYADRHGLLLNGRVNNLEYGSRAPGAPEVFLDDAAFARLWLSGRRCYLAIVAPALPRVRELVGSGALHEVASAGGKFLFQNQPPARQGTS